MADDPGRPRRPSRVGRVLRRLLKLAWASASCWRSRWGWSSAGRRSASGPRAPAARAWRRRPQWRQDHFVNPQPLINDARAMLGGLFHPSPFTSPQGPVPVATGGGARFATPPATGLRVTWFGHSSTLVEIDGHRVLTDPVWSERASPIPGVGPRAWYAPPLALADLPPIDVVVISHDHYDHLDRRTDRRARRRRPRPRLEHHLRRAAGDRRAPRLLGRARRAHRRARLVAAHARRRSRDRLHAGAPRLGAHGRRQRRQAVGRLGAAGAAPPRLLLGRHRPVPRRCATSARAWARST